MNSILKSMYDSFIEELNTTKRDEINKLLQAKKCIESGTTAMAHLKEYVLKTAFKSLDEEIIFFREIKPKFHSELLYWSDVYRITLQMPEGLIETKEKFISNQLLATEITFSNNLAFCYYYKSGDSIMDESYFLRKNNNTVDRDPSFATSHDFLVTRILADKKLQFFLKELQDNIENIIVGEEVKATANNLIWTSSKAGLVELIYALQSCAVYNNGNAGIREIAESFEKLFAVDLGNYYNVFNEIRLRKKSRTQLLDQLKERLMAKIDELDEK